MGNITYIANICYNHDRDDEIPMEPPKFYSLTSFHLNQSNVCDSDNEKENYSIGYDNDESEFSSSNNTVEISPISSFGCRSCVHSFDLMNTNITIDSAPSTTESTITRDQFSPKTVEKRTVKLGSCEVTPVSPVESQKQSITLINSDASLSSPTSLHSQETPEIPIVHVGEATKNYKEMKGEVLFSMMQSPSILRMKKRNICFTLNESFNDESVSLPLNATDSNIIVGDVVNDMYIMDIACGDYGSGDESDSEVNKAAKFSYVKNPSRHNTHALSQSSLIQCIAGDISYVSSPFSLNYSSSVSSDEDEHKDRLIAIECIDNDKINRYTTKNDNELSAKTETHRHLSVDDDKEVSDIDNRIHRSSKPFNRHANKHQSAPKNCLTEIVPSSKHECNDEPKDDVKPPVKHAVNSVVYMSDVTTANTVCAVDDELFIQKEIAQTKNSKKDTWYTRAKKVLPFLKHTPPPPPAAASADMKKPNNDNQSTKIAISAHSSLNIPEESPIAIADSEIIAIHAKDLKTFRAKPFARVKAVVTNAVGSLMTRKYK